jgi:hypothetical protein
MKPIKMDHDARSSKLILVRNLNESFSSIFFNRLKNGKLEQTHPPLSPIINLRSASPCNKCQGETSQ